MLTGTLTGTRSGARSGSRSGSVGRPGAGPGSRVRRLLLGGPDDPRWSRPALWAVLAVACALYTWNLPGGGDANAYYSAAVKSGTQSWKAFFFGSLDAGSFITVDKPPMALWVQGLFARVLGFSTWSLLLPQALAGTASVAVLHQTVRRAFGPAAALAAAVVLTLTPITVAIDRDNNPDTLLVLLLVGAAWAAQRAVAGGRVRMLLLAAFLVGCGFNTKMLQAFLVVPALAAVYLVAARPGIWRRLAHLVAAGAVLAVSSLWWTLLVDAIPARSRPFIGGSTDGTVWDLVVGYNGLGRIFGRSGPGGGGQSGGFGGEPGAGRLFNDVLGGQISWLLPLAALSLLVGALALAWRPRRDLRGAALLLWGLWLAVHFAVFSFAEGTFHPYYSTAMAPAVAALCGAGVPLLAALYRRPRWAWAVPVCVAVTGGWAFALLARTPQWHPWLRWAVAAAAVAAVLGLLAGRYLPGLRPGVWHVVVPGALAAAVFAGLAGPGAYAVAAAASPVNGTNPLAGPSSGGGFPGGGPSRGGTRGGFPGGPGGMPGGAPGGAAGGMPGGASGTPGGASGGASGNASGNAPSGVPSGGMRPGGGRGGFGGGPGGGLDSAMVSYLEREQGSARWLVAVSSAQSASSVILRTGRPVIAMGGFTGSDPAMTVAKLQGLVASGQVKFVLLGGGFGPDGGNDAVTAWVRAHGTAVPASQYGGTSQDTGSSGSAGSSAGLYRLGAS
ncbi:ArnT family glycosyltransferase [Actinomadura atramentaria]|uniref:ArnT family glycosyltransferase n=1 Tax=Actinomadura atramentaria TaxID=1990 RepID=UPI0009FF58C6|nr:glycosyltransferase family 39 protein [Actinomadura atramentaria]